MCKKPRGFTLIEMLIVITIIALLASIILVGMGGARAKARDARRIADLRNVQNALELYFSSKSVYPSATTWDGLATVLTEVNVNRIPIDPNPGSGYQYCPGTDNLSYTLAAQLETDDPALNDSFAPGACGGITCGKTNKGYCLAP